MKKITALLMSLLIFAIALVSCSGAETTTAEFYASMDQTCFWFKATVTEGETSYTYIQAVKGNTVTTIEDRENDDNDAYHIFNGNAIHKLNLKTKTYDTEITTLGIKLMFSAYDYEDFNRPKSTGREVLNGKSYYCETFDAADADGKTVGENKYYFEDDKLKAIVWTEEGKTVRTMLFEDYGNSVPDDIYLAPPEDFTAGILTQTNEIPYSEIFGEDGILE